MTKGQNPEQENTLSLPHIEEKDLMIENEIEKREKSPIVIFTLVGFLVACTIGFFTYGAISGSMGKSDSEGSSLESTSATDDDYKEPIEKIAYIQDGNVWVYEIYSGKKVQITGDGSADTVYTTLTWKDKERLSFSRCDQEACLIHTYNVPERRTEDIFKIKAKAIVGLRYSHDGQMLALLYNDGMNIHLDLKYTGDQIKLYEFSNGLEQSVNFVDASYVRFSEDDQKLMLIFTKAKLTKVSLIVFDLNGSIIAKIEKDDGISCGMFVDDTTIFFKKGSYISEYDLETEEENVISKRIVDPYCMELSFDRSSITYWTYDYKGGFTTVWTYNLNAEKLSRIIDQYILPRWLDEKSLVAVKIKQCFECALESFEVESLDQIDLNTRSTKTLVKLDEVTYFTADNV